MNIPTPLVPPQVKTLEALYALSNAPKTVTVDDLLRTVHGAPDPETAVRTVLDAVGTSSEVLERKWRNTITNLWSTHHPAVPLLPALPLASADVAHVPILQDAHAYLEEILCQPALLTQDHDDTVINSNDVWRLAAKLPSLAGRNEVPVESEWAYIPMRRLRAVLQALRLVRPVKGKLVVVRSRYERFKAYPATQQFYALWHADMYHVDWSEFAGMWGRYVRVVQDYLPLLWDVGENVAAGQLLNQRRFCVDVLETFAPLWDEEGLLDVGQGQAAILPIVQQHALPAILETFIITDVLQRHGLIESAGLLGSTPQFVWTEIGSQMFQAELTQELPCGIELLSRDSASMTRTI